MARWPEEQARPEFSAGPHQEAPAFSQPSFGSAQLSPGNPTMSLQVCRCLRQPSRKVAWKDSLGPGRQPPDTYTAPALPHAMHTYTHRYLHAHSTLTTLDTHRLGHTRELRTGKAWFPDPMTSETFSQNSPNPPLPVSQGQGHSGNQPD